MGEETGEGSYQSDGEGTSAWVIAFSVLAMVGFAAGLFAGWLIWR